jgi:hypothetical protein
MSTIRLIQSLCDHRGESDTEAHNAIKTPGIDVEVALDVLAKQSSLS